MEDEPSIRVLINELLTLADFTVQQVGDASAGLRILQSSVAINLLIATVALPSTMNGCQMVDVARATRKDLKVLFLTG